MTQAVVLRAGLVSSDLTRSNKLSKLLSENGVVMIRQLELSALMPEFCRLTDLDVWLIDLAEDDWSDVLDDMLADAAIPVFINEQGALVRQSHPEFWIKKLIVRLGELVLAESMATVGALIPEPVLPPAAAATAASVAAPTNEADFPLWVLGASLGGPAALKGFLQALPDVVNAAFILCQHIDSNFVPVLCKILEDYSSFEVWVPGDTPRMPAPGELILAPVDRRVRLAADGSIRGTRESWTPPYAPCIDDVMSEVARNWPGSGALVFSGMGGDGVRGATSMREHGYSVWTQSAASCANSSMPDEIRQAGLSELSASPKQLAHHFVAQAYHKPRGVGPLFLQRAAGIVATTGSTSSLKK